jgi:hypothetical protein
LESGRADSRFLLPGPMDAAVVGDSPGGWRDELSKFEITDTVVAPTGALASVLSSRPESLLVEGRVRPAVLERAGYRVQRYAALPSSARPLMVVPLGEPGPARYTLLTWFGPGRRWARARNRLVAITLARGVVPARLALTVASMQAPVPRLISETAYLGLPPDPVWTLAPAQGDRLSRAIFLVFPRGEGQPSHAVKFARVAGWAKPFELDEAALKLLDHAGGRVTRRVPRLLGRRAVDGFEASVETAAPGERLIGFLHGFAPRRDKRRVIDEIADWVLELGASTRASPAALAPERERLAHELLRDRRGLPDMARLLDGLEKVPAVLQHNDLGTWNISVGAGTFMVLDWESARRHAFPLWDLWYFLMDAEAHLAGAATLEEREEHFARLFSGGLPASEELFRWTARAAAALDVPEAALGGLATLCWMHHGQSTAVREAELSRFEEDCEPAFWLRLLERFRDRWLSDPALGPGWPALRTR